MISPQEKKNCKVLRIKKELQYPEASVFSTGSFFNKGAEEKKNQGKNSKKNQKTPSSL